MFGCQSSKLTVKIITSTQATQWYNNENFKLTSAVDTDSFDIQILTDSTLQTIDGFGGSFNELGWLALQLLDEKVRTDVFKALFSSQDCNFTICRMPIGANDFATDWYSLNETAGDYAMKNFNIDRDTKRLIPYIKSAMVFQPDLKIWGSPWCPPSWMKKNGYYACSPNKFNELDPSLPRRENGETDFILDAKTQSAYALYFCKYIQAYRDEDIHVYAVHVQNEPHSCQPFPSCLWKGADLKNYIRDFLGPAFRNNGIDAEIWYGTFERPYDGEWAQEIDMLLDDNEVMQYITGIGFQWAGKDAIAAIHQKRPDLKLMHTEAECGDGRNTWTRAEYIYELFCHYFDNGANSQMHWNMILEKDLTSPWGWKQNSMISIDPQNKTVIFNPEFYIMKHFSYFIRPGAVMLDISGQKESELAFRNPNGELVVLLHNKSTNEKKRMIKIKEKFMTVEIPGNSVNTLVLAQKNN